MAQITTVEKQMKKFNPTTAGTSTNPGGLPAPVQGPVAWALTGPNTSGATLEPITDGSNPTEDPKNQGLYAWFISGDTEQLEALTIEAKGDADMGDGIREVIATDTQTVISAEAANAGLTDFPPVPK